MTNKKICIELIGNAQLLDGGIEAFVYQNGYQDKIVDTENNEIDNPKTKLEFARDVLSKFMRENIIAYKVEIARTQAAETTKTSSETELDTMTISVVEE
jgi:nitroimidazol reductase NimA-like FMN-containing flavoprotein (pyridoxamine 5'-phosphate oxidase superfamily)